MSTENTSDRVPVQSMNRVLKLGFGALAVGLILLLAGGPLYRFGLVGLGFAFTLMRYSLYVNLLAAGLCLIGGVLHAKRHGWPRTAGPVVAVCIALAMAYMPVSLYQQARSVPPIHDISTDTQSPPVFVALAEMRAEDENPVGYAGEEVASKQREAYPDIQSLYFDADAENVFAQAEAAARAMGWEVVAAVAAEGRIEAVATTRWFGFRDDVVIRIQPVPGQEQVRLDIRSQSRVGVSDLGANAKRIRAYRERLSRVMEF